MLGSDWILGIYPAVRAFLTGGNPYTPTPDPLGGYHYPAWLLPLVAPLGLMPPAWGAVVMGLLVVSGLVALCVRVKRPWVALLMAVSIPMLTAVYWANVEGLCLWGLVVGGPVGFFLLSVKPQVASLAGLVWAWEAYQKERWRGVVKLVAPTAIIATVLTLVYPQSIAAMLESRREAGTYAINFWPWLALPGLVLLVLAIKKGRISWACVSTVTVAPYVRYQSFIAANTLIAAEYPVLGVLWVAAPWAYLLVRLLLRI